MMEQQLDIFTLMAEMDANNTNPVIMPKEKDEKLTDFGEKIGLARKDLWADRNLGFQDTLNMNELEMRKYVTKNNVYPSPKWKEDAEKWGADKFVLFLKKKIRDSLPTRPGYIYCSTSEEANKNFIELLDSIRERLEDIHEYEEFEKLKGVLEEHGFLEDRTITFKGLGLQIDKVYRAIQETMPRNKEWAMFKYLHSGFLDEKKSSTSSAKPRKKKMKIEHLEILNEEGFNYRQGKDATPEDILSLGFRGGEFGNWTNQAERQKHLNYTYDSINNMAVALDITPQQLTHPQGVGDYEALGIGFGSRGHSEALAHYEPLCHVINLTRMKGAGSLAHELGHALDHMIAQAFFNERIRNFAFERKGCITNEKIRKAASVLNDTILRKRLTNAETVEYYSEKVKKEEQAIRDFFKKFKEKVCQNKEDEEKFDEIIREYMYEVSFDYSGISEDIRNEIKELSYKNLLMATLESYPLKGKLIAHRCNLATWQARRKQAAEEGTCLLVDTKFVSDAKTIDANYSKMGQGYWASEVELFARAFACYIKDKLTEKGIVDDYLTGHADDNGVCYDGVTVYTAPQGKERQAINQAFDRYIKALKDENFF